VPELPAALLRPPAAAAEDRIYSRHPRPRRQRPPLGLVQARDVVGGVDEELQQPRRQKRDTQAATVRRRGCM